LNPRYQPFRNYLAMHIPDGFLDAKTALTTATLSAVAVTFALRQVRRELPPRRVPLLGLSAAFLFAAQMINFPIAGGTSGHLLGGTLIAVLLGPSAAVVVVTTVLIVQCFLFADGGVLVLGANIFNMGLVATLSGYAVYRCLTQVWPGPRGRIVALTTAGWISTISAAFSCAGQLAWSQTLAWQIAWPAMTSIHALIGLGEGIISALILIAITRTRPDLVATSSLGVTPVCWREFSFLGLLISLGLACFVAPFASSAPDGLETVAIQGGFAHRALAPLRSVLAPDYQIPSLNSTALSTALAGIVGITAALGLALLISRLVLREASPKKILRQ
jgi:cobalt/nickel transport system permease protein